MLTLADAMAQCTRLAPDRSICIDLDCWSHVHGDKEREKHFDVAWRIYVADTSPGVQGVAYNGATLEQALAAFLESHKPLPTTLDAAQESLGSPNQIQECCARGGA